MNYEPAYQEALDYLYRYVDYSLKKNFIYSPENFNLERMRAFMQMVGNPQDTYPTLHIAGTKGKGSVSALCASALRAAGYCTGLYTSPHMLDFCERIQVDGVPMSHPDFVLLVDELKPHIATVPQITFFEITTALAFLYFHRRQVDAAVIEVGLGGRLDSTNIITPLVSVITSLSYDHTQVLGNTLAEIAGEKAGIIKPGVPVVLSPQKEEANGVVARIAAERGAPLIQAGVDYLFRPLFHSLEGQSMLVERAGEVEAAEAVQLEIPLLGLHQVENACVAFAALEAVRGRGLRIEQADIVKGFAQVSWPGRFEILRRTPPVLVDAAHNRDSALRLRETIDDYFPNIPVILVIGASEDKDIEGIFTELLPRVRHLVATQAVHPRAIEPVRLVEMANQMGYPATPVSGVDQAMDEALRLAGTECLVLVTGSVFLVAEARQAWAEKAGRTFKDAREDS